MAFAVNYCDMIHCSYEICQNELKRGVAQGGTAPAAVRTRAIEGGSLRTNNIDNFDASASFVNNSRRLRREFLSFAQNYGFLVNNANA